MNAARAVLVPVHATVGMHGVAAAFVLQYANVLRTILTMITPALYCAVSVIAAARVTIWNSHWLWDSTRQACLPFYAAFYEHLYLYLGFVFTRTFFTKKGKLR